MICVTGDTHGELIRFSDKKIHSMKKGDTLLICGDFGFLWDDTKKERKTLKSLEKLRFTIAFVDGTHENFEKLNGFAESEWNGGRVHRLSDNLVHLMRGEIYEIEGKKFFVFGGGESPDKEIRREEGRWWSCELPSLEELAHGRERLAAVGNEVDYIITHEPAGSVRCTLNNESDEYHLLHAFLDEVAKSCTFKRWYFGSCHMDKVISPRQVAVFNAVHLIEQPQQGKRR